MDTQVLISLISAFSAITVAALGIWGAKRNKAANLAKKEIEFQKETFDLSDFLADWNQFYWELQKIMHETNLDRFLILRAWNGKADPRYTTAVLQLRQGTQEPVSYIHVQLDEDYTNRLLQVKARGHIYFKVDDLDKCLIRDIYKAEGVVASLWVYLETKEEGEHARMTYCSFATHNENGFTDYEITKMVLLFGQLKGIA